jgi:pseudouridine synthase
MGVQPGAEALRRPLQAELARASPVGRAASALLAAGAEAAPRLRSGRVRPYWTRDMARRRTPRSLQAARAGGWTQAAGGRPDWVARALARAGVLAPAQAEQAVRAGRVTIGGRRVREPLSLVQPGEEVRIDGRPVDLCARSLVLAFHKPKDAVVARSDPQGMRTVFDLLLPRLPPELARYGWHAVGRLDRDTTGLLLFTNDERFVAYATKPETHLPKRYLAQVGAAPEDPKLEPLRQGVDLHDGPARPARARVRGERAVELTLTEGRNHQVKRMLGAIGLPVTALHREAIGELELDVPEGAFRLLSQDEVRAKLGFEQGGSSPAPLR